MATWPPTLDDDGTGTSGTVVNDAFMDAVKAYIDTGSGYGWQSVPFSAANFVGQAPLVLTVAANQVTWNRYVVLGTTMIWTLWVQGATLSGSPANLISLKIPAGKSAVTPGSGFAATAQCYDGTHGGAFVTPDSSGLYLRLQRTAEGNFGASGVFYLLFTITFEVNP